MSVAGPDLIFLLVLSCSVAPFSLFFGGCPTKNGLPKKGFPFFQGH